MTVPSSKNNFDDLPFLEMSKELANEFGLDEKYFIEILGEASDWEFITKMAAIYEAGATELLVQCFAKEELRKEFSLLPLCGERGSKVSFIKALGLLTDDSLNRIKNFATIRNSTVHSTKTFKISLAEYMTELRESNRNLLKELQRTFYFNSSEDHQLKNYSMGFIIRMGMCGALCMFLMEVYLNKSGENYNKAMKELKKQFKD